MWRVEDVERGRGDVERYGDVEGRGMEGGRGMWRWGCGVGVGVRGFTSGPWERESSPS